jgi:cell division protein FtsW
MIRHHSFKLFKQTKKPDFVILAITFLLGLFGLIMIFEASNVSAFRDFADKYHYVKEQFVSLILGFVIMITISFVNYKKYFSLAVPLILFCIVSLIAVFIPGLGVKAMGAHRWIDFKIINFQPSELTKLISVIYLSSWLTSKEKGRFISFLLLMLVIIGLVIVQPDLGTSIILGGIFIIIYLLSEAPLWHFSVLLPVSLFCVFALSILSPYRYNRIMTFFNPDLDPLGSSYHIRQILISFGSGGLWGVGLGESLQKYQFLPEATTDSIFAIIGEEFGFIGCTVIIFIMMYFIYRIYLVVRNAPDKFSFLLSGGILALFSFQILINLGAMVAIFPLTGTPLPFISYGGTNLIISFATIGILLNISKYAVKK